MKNIQMDRRIVLARSSVQNVAFCAKPLEAMTEPLQELYSLWNGKRGQRRFPSKDELTPRDLKPFLQRISLIRVLDGGNDFEFRVVGDAVIQLAGINFQGHKASEFAHFQRLVSVVHRPVVETGVPFAVDCVVEKADQPHVYREILALPLGTADETVDHLLTMSVDLA